MGETMSQRIATITVNAQYAAFPFTVQHYRFDLADYDIAIAVYRVLKAEQEREGYERVWFYRSYR
jgi:hypothetical protein